MMVSNISSGTFSLSFPSGVSIKCVMPFVVVPVVGFF
jgi:hypothetical protein